MKWEFWIDLYVNRHCAARGLLPRTISAYEKSLQGFRAYVRFRLADRAPDEVAPRDLLEYVEYLRRERRNGASAVNRQVTILKNFYRAMVAMNQLDDKRNPMAHFPRIKAAPTKLPVFLSEDETRRLIRQPRTGPWLLEKLFHQGGLRPWNEALEYLTGEKLNPEYFVGQFVS